MKIRFIILIAFLYSLTACQAMIYGTASSMDQLRVGMTKEQVIRVMGDPVAVSVDSDKKEEYLIYKKMKHAISMWSRTYQVTLREGKVVKWGEQYNEQNLNSF